MLMRMRAETEVEGAEHLGLTSNTRELEACVEFVLEFLESKCFFSSVKALRTEMELAQRESRHE